MDDDYTIARIAKIKTIIETIEDTLVLIAANPNTSFSINTGQTQESVTSRDIGSLQNNLTEMYNLLATLEARVYGSAVTVIPAW